MRIILSPDEMRSLEARYFEETGVASETLMERAAQAAVAQGVVEALNQRLHGAQGRRALFACGPGNNGGDGYAAARLFADRGGRALVLTMGDPERQKGDALKNLKRIRTYPGVEFTDFERVMKGERPDAWVDALFGIGLSRPVGSPARFFGACGGYPLGSGWKERASAGNCGARGRYGEL